MSGMVGFFAAKMHASPRALAEFGLVAVALILANPTPTSIYMGILLALTGECFRLWSAGYGYRSGQHLVQGPYRYVRHPYYLGTILVIGGLSLASRSTVAFGLSIAVLGAIFWVRMRDDEAILEAKLGPDFAPYRSGVPALLPQFIPYSFSGALKNENPSDFSFSRALLKGRRREVDALIGIFLGFLVLYIAFLVPNKAIFRIGVSASVLLLAGLRILYYRGI